MNMNNYIFLILSFFIFSETVSQPQKSLVAYDGRSIRIKYFKNEDGYKVSRRSNADVHVKLKIKDNRLKSLTNKELKNAIKVDFVDSLGNIVQGATLGFSRYSKPRDVGEVKETGNLKPTIILRNRNAIIDIEIPIRRRLIRTGGEGIVGYHFPIGRCSIRITVRVGEEEQVVFIPLLVK